MREIQRVHELFFLYKSCIFIEEGDIQQKCGDLGEFLQERQDLFLNLEKRSICRYDKGNLKRPEAGKFHLSKSIQETLYIYLGGNDKCSERWQFSNAQLLEQPCIEIDNI